jgi:glyoxylase-like metal-dependent hydrolase (beta-lactamase superfamily II)
VAPAVLRLGSLTVVSLSDGALAAPAAGFFPAVPATAWVEEAAFLNADGVFGMNIGCFLIREGESWTLVDTGDGTRPGSCGGKLLAGLRAAHVSPDDITRVIFTHLHGDHIGGTTADCEGQAQLVFPHARHIVQRQDWEALPQLAASAPQLRRCVDPVMEAGLLERIDGDVALTPSISLLLTPGHTPGHQCVLLSSHGEQAVIIGDLAHTPMQLNHPDWQPGTEFDPEQAVRSRAALFDRIQQEGLTLCAGHFPYPSIGTVVRVAQRRRWISLGEQMPRSEGEPQIATGPRRIEVG